MIVVMRRIAAILLLARLGLAVELRSGESILDRSVESTGKTEVLAQIKNSIMRGTARYVISGHALNASIVMTWEKGKLYSIGQFATAAFESGCDGPVAWSNDSLNGPKILRGNDGLYCKRAAELGSTFDWRKVFREARTLGSQVVNGKPAWKVEMFARDGGPPDFYLFDRDSGLMVGYSGATYSMAVGDYRSVDGIMTPFTMEESVNGSAIYIRLNTVMYNQPLPQNQFDLPLPVKHLIAARTPVPR